MFTMPVKFTDFNGNDREKKLYFNLNKPELIKLLRERPNIQNELGELADKLGKKNAGDGVYIEFVTFIDDLIRLSYGEKTEDGNFRKNEAILEDFTTSNAYEALFTEFFNDPKKFDTFIENIFPADIMTEALKEQAKKQAEEIANQ